MRRTVWAACVAAAAVAACAPGSTEPTDAGAGFRWTVSPDSQRVEAGQAAAFSIDIASKSSLNSRVNLSAGPAPPGVTLSIDPPRLSETVSHARLTVQTTAGTPLTVHTIGVTATEDGLPPETIPVSLTVGEPLGPGPDFDLVVEPIELALSTAAREQTVTVRVTSRNGFQDLVETTLSGATDDLRILDFAPRIDIPASAGGAGFAFGVRFEPSGPVTSPVLLTLTAASGAIRHTRQIRVNLPTVAAPAR